MARTPRELPEEILQKVIALREGHSSWIKIQKEAKIDRRTAQRAYLRWERSKSIDELKAARKGTAETEFRNHLHYLVTLAEVLAQTLDIPGRPNVTTSAGEILENIWENNRLKNYSVYGVKYVRASSEARSLLLASLKTHTSAKVRWDALEDWEEAWDECIYVIKELRQRTHGVLHNILEQYKFMEKLKKGSKKQDIFEQLVSGVFYTVWEQILHPYDKEQFPILEIESRSDGRNQILFGQGKFVAGIVLDTDMCKQVAEFSKLAAKSLLLSTELEAINSLIETMQERIKELQHSLNPLLLGPLIMSTRCDLCPA